MQGEGQYRNDDPVAEDVGEDCAGDGNGDEGFAGAEMEE